jgi:hypothetical protein
MPLPLIEALELRQLLTAAPSLADLLVDSNRDGLVTPADDANEDVYTNGKTGRGAIVLPNVDKDNTTTAAPDNWAGGVWNGRPVAPNNVIDNAADLLDIAKLRLAKLPVDDIYNYRVTLQILKPASDPAWFKDVPAADRVRLFFPTRALASGDVVAQPGDVAVIGPGLGDTIRFVNNPEGVNDFNIADLAGHGALQFGVEGLKAGAQIRVRVTVEFDPILTDTQGPIDGPIDDPAPTPPPAVDEVALRVAPFVLQDDRQRAQKVFVENMNRYGLDNAEARAALKRVFGDRLIESRSGDLWQQDGYEIGYAAAPYGQMPVVLELPRARDVFFDQAASMRSFVRGSLLSANVGVSIELAAKPNTGASTFGGDIESLPRPNGAPGFLLASGMPAYMRDFFAAQGVNPLLDLKLDDWLGVGHVDEVVHLGAGGNKVLIADPDLAWALALWAVKLDPSVRLHPGMNGNESLPDYTTAGLKASVLLAHPTLRKQNLEYLQSTARLGGVHDAIKKALNLTDELTTPSRDPKNTGAGSLLRGGAFTRFLSSAPRTFEVKFLDGDRYQLRYTDAGQTPSKWFDGRKSRDEVFPDARAFLLKNYWAGNFKAGDRFTYATNPAATLVKMPVLFGSFGVLFDDPNTPPPPTGWRFGALSTNHVNSLTDGDTVVTGKAYGPQVNWNGNGKSDLFQAYANATFKGVGYKTVEFTDTRLYHDSGGGIHCGTNALRALPTTRPWDFA